MSDLRKVTEGDVTVYVRKPNPMETNKAQIVYNKAWREALDGGAMLQQKLNDYLVKQGVWDEDKQKKYEDFVKKINECELALKKGGKSLKEGRNIAIKLKRLRFEFRDLIAERSNYDSLTAEGVADNIRFDYLVSNCIVDEGGKKIFKDVDDYNSKATEDWVIKAAGEFARILYNIDPNYEKALPENNFLTKFRLVDSDGRLVNKDGHLITVDEDGVERLINSDGYYVAYDENGKQYRVNRDGEKIEDIDEITPEPFYDDDGNPIVFDDDGNIVQNTSKERKNKK